MCISTAVIKSCENKKNNKYRRFLKLVLCLKEDLIGLRPRDNSLWSFSAGLSFIKLAPSYFILRSSKLNKLKQQRIDLNHLSSVVDVWESWSDDAGQNGLESRFETPERWPVMLVQNGENLAQEVLVTTAWFAVQNYRPYDDQLIVYL